MHDIYNAIVCNNVKAFTNKLYWLFYFLSYTSKLNYLRSVYTLFFICYYSTKYSDYHMTTKQQQHKFPGCCFSVKTLFNCTCPYFTVYTAAILTLLHSHRPVLFGQSSTFYFAVRQHIYNNCSLLSRLLPSHWNSNSGWRSYYLLPFKSNIFCWLLFPFLCHQNS